MTPDTYERFVILVDIVDSEDIERKMSSLGPSAYKDQIIRPILGKLQRLCDQVNGTLSATASNPFIIEVSGAKTLVKATDALVGGSQEYRINVPQPLVNAGYDAIRFYIGVALTKSDRHENYQGVSYAHTLAGGAGPDQVHVDSEVATILTTSDLEALELILRGQQRLSEEEPASFVFQLLPNTREAADGTQRQEIVKLTLGVVDIMGSTKLKALMDGDQQQRLEQYDQGVLKPFKTTITRLTGEYGGTIIDSTGDAYFVSFAEEEDARRWAVACVDSENRIKAPENYGFAEIKYHLSIDSGRVLRDTTGNLQGTHVDRVHRLNDLSREDQIILSPPVGTLLIEALTHPETEGKVIRHEAKNLQGIVGETDVYEYCPPGVESRPPREGKGGVQFTNYSLASIPDGEPYAADSPVIKTLLKRYDGRPAVPMVAGDCLIFAFSSVPKATRFLIECRNRAPRSDRRDFHGLVHYGLLMDKDEGRLEGADLTRAQRLFHDCPDGTLVHSNAAQAQIHQTYNRWFKLQPLKQKNARSRRSREPLFEIIPKLPFAVQSSLAAALLVLLSVLAWWGHRTFIVAPQLTKQSSFVSLTPGIGGSWWFDETPWYTPRMRLRLYEDRRSLDPDDLKEIQEYALAGTTQKFAEKLEESLPQSFFDDSPAAQALRPASETASSETIKPLLERRFLKDSEPAAVDWHLLANLLSQLSRDDKFVLGDAIKALSDTPYPGLRKITGNSGFDQSIAAFNQAISIYDSQSNPDDVHRGLVALCYSDMAETYMRHRLYSLSGKKFAIATRELRGDLAPLLNARVLTLSGEGIVRQTFSSSGSRKNAIDNQNYNEVFFAPALACLDKVHAANNHPLRALVEQRQAHYFLETWQLRKTDRTASNATEIRSEFPSVQSLIDICDSCGVHSGNLHSCQEYLRCQLLRALAAHFTGNNDTAENTLEKSIGQIKAAANTAEGKDADMWRTQLTNFLQRNADHHLFAYGDLLQARKSFEESLVEANKAGHHEDSHPLHGYYLAQQARVAWLAAVANDTDGYGNALSAFDGGSSSDFNADKFEGKRYWLSLSVAQAFNDPDRIHRQLVNVIRNGRELYVRESLSRDDRQLLLFVCKYLELEHQDEPLAESDISFVNDACKDFAEPWKKFPSYLKLIELSTEKLRGEFIRNHPQPIPAPVDE